MNQLSQEIHKACRDLSLNGYEVVSITPGQSGVGGYNFPSGRNGGAGWGYSYTQGVVITARKKESFRFEQQMKEASELLKEVSIALKEQVKEHK